MTKNKHFEMITDNSVWINKFSLEDIDYSILLTKVFGKPVDTASAFMYLFRRYGFTNIGSDDYKKLCSYAFHTNNEEIIVGWGMAYPGSYQYHLCAFADKTKIMEWEQAKNSRPLIDFEARHNNPIEAAEKQHAWILTFDEDSILRQTYFAAMALFEDWKKPTYVRDVYFNLAGEDENTFSKTKDENNEDTINSVVYSNNAGYGIPTALFEGANFKIVQDFLAKPMSDKTKNLSN